MATATRQEMADSRRQSTPDVNDNQTLTLRRSEIGRNINERRRPKRVGTRILPVALFTEHGSARRGAEGKMTVCSGDGALRLDNANVFKRTSTSTRSPTEISRRKKRQSMSSVEMNRIAKLVGNGPQNRTNSVSTRADSRNGQIPARPGNVDEDNVQTDTESTEINGNSCESPMDFAEYATQSAQPSVHIPTKSAGFVDETATSIERDSHSAADSGVCETAVMRNKADNQAMTGGDDEETHPDKRSLISTFQSLTISAEKSETCVHYADSPIPRNQELPSVISTPFTRRSLRARRRLDFSGMESNAALRQREANASNSSPRDSPRNPTDGSHINRNQTTTENEDGTRTPKPLLTRARKRFLEESERQNTSQTCGTEISVQPTIKKKANNDSLRNVDEAENVHVSFQGQETFRTSSTWGNPGREIQPDTKGSDKPELLCRNTPLTTTTPGTKLNLARKNVFVSRSLSDPSFWQTLRLDNCELVYAQRNARFFTRLFKTNGSYIESLTICSLLPTTDSQVEQVTELVSRYCRNIRELTVDFPDFQDSSLKHIILTNKLQKLSVRRMFIKSFRSLIICLMPLTDLKELEIHLDDEFEVDMDQENIWRLVVVITQFFRRNRFLRTVKLFFAANTEIVRSLLKNCHHLTHLELHLHQVSRYLQPRAFEVPHVKLNTLIIRSQDLLMTDVWQQTITTSFPSLQTLELTGLRQGATILTHH